MPALPNSLALNAPADGTTLIASRDRNNDTSVQAAVNALIAALSNGTAGQVLQAVSSSSVQWAGGYTNYTPALTASSVNPTLGAGSVVNGRYLQLGKFVHCEGRIIFGSSGVVAGSGTYRVSLPVNYGAAIGDDAAGAARLFDSSAAALALPSPTFDGTNAGYFIFEYPSTWPSGPFTRVTDAAPWTWAASDELHWSIIYESV